MGATGHLGSVVAERPLLALSLTGLDAKEPRRAAILEVDPYGSGLRNPNGMDWAPGTRMLWTVVNERDDLGDDLVPDYLTSVREGAFYGWSYSYFGQNPRKKGERPNLVAKAVVPNLAIGAHTASLGLTFYDASAFPPRCRGGTFIGQHGSWNRSRFAGYKVIFAPGCSFQRSTGGLPDGFHRPRSEVRGVRTTGRSVAGRIAARRGPGRKRGLAGYLCWIRHDERGWTWLR